MQAGFEVKIPIYFLIAIISVVLVCHFLSRGRRSLPLYSYIAVQASIFLWAVHDMINEIYSILPPTQLDKELIHTVYVSMDFFITCFISYSWLIFSLSYTNFKPAVNKKLLSVLLFLPAALYCLLYLSSDGYSFYGGPVFLTYIAMCYAYLAAGTVIMVIYTLKQKGYMKKQTLLLSLCLILPLALSMVQNYKLHVLRTGYEILGLDMTLLSFSVTLLMVAIAAFRYRFLNPAPYAMKELFNNMDQPMVIIDSKNLVIEVNGSFSKSLPEGIRLKPDDDAGSLAKQLKGMAKVSPARDRVIYEIEKPYASLYSENLTLGFKPEKHFKVTVRPIVINKDEYIGKVIIFNDITGLVGMIDELNEKNTELSAINDNLREYSSTVEALAVERERNRLTRDIHDTLGQSMTILNTVLQEGLISCGKDLAVTKEKLCTAIRITKESITELRKAVLGFVPGDLNRYDLVNLLECLIKEYAVSGLKVELSVEGLEGRISSKQAAFLYRLCQEAITNSLRHGKADNVNIVIQTQGDCLRAFISDNGQGCAEVIKGQGLSGMEQRAGELDGWLRYGGGEGSGFSLYVELPLGNISKKGGDAICLK